MKIFKGSSSIIPPVYLAQLLIFIFVWDPRVQGGSTASQLIPVPKVFFLEIPFHSVHCVCLRPQISLALGHRASDDLLSLRGGDQ